MRKTKKNLKERAKHSPSFEKFAVNFAQAYHQGDVRLRRRLLGYKTEEVRALDKDKAIELGASIVGEATILLVACAAVSFEWLRLVLPKKKNIYYSLFLCNLLKTLFFKFN